MFDNFTPKFKRALSGFNRFPITLIEFTLHNGEVYYLSDIKIGKADGLDNNYHPWVENWGSLLDSSNEQTVFTGRALEAKSMQLSIISNHESRFFITELYRQGIDNTIVTLYQLFKGLTEQDKTIIDVLVCQDPILLQEKSMLFRLDLVSTIMRNNNQLFPRKPGEKFQDIVVGKAIGLPLIDLHSSSYTSLREEIGDTFTGSVIVGNTIGFPGSGTIAIDSEFLLASVVDSSTLNITARGQHGSTARSHLRDAVISIYNANYDYAVCAGPVMLLDNLLADGQPYQHDYQSLINENPVKVRFNTRPPWMNTVNKPNPPIQPPDETGAEFGRSYETDTDETGGDSYICCSDSINSDSGSASMELTSVTDDEEIIPPNTGTANFKSNPFPVCGGDVSDQNPPPSNDLMRCTSGSLTVFCDRSFGEDYLTDPGVQGNFLKFFENIVAPRPDTQITSSFLTIPAVMGKACNADIEFWSTYDIGSGEVEINRGKIENYTGLVDDHLTFPENEIQLPITEWDDFNNLKGTIYLLNLVCGCDEYQFCSDGNVQSAFQLELLVNYEWPSDPPPPVEYFQPSHELVSEFDDDLSYLGTFLSVSVTVKYSVTLSNAEVLHRIVQRSTNDPEDDTILSEQHLTDNLGVTEETFSLYASSWGDLENLRIGIYEQITGPEIPSLTRQAICTFDSVIWNVSYRPPAIPQPDTPIIVYANNLTCDITSLLGADPTPAQVIKHLIEVHSSEGKYVDQADFTERHEEYFAESFFFNGVFPGNIRLHDAIRECLFQGLARLLYSHGKIKLLTYLKPATAALNHYIPNEQVLLKSREIKSQPTNFITNYVNALYDLTYGTDGNYQESYIFESPESISKYTYKVQTLELSLINSEAIAKMAADRLVSIYKDPLRVLKMDIFLPEGFKIDKGDQVLFRDFLIPGSGWVAKVLGMNRVFASGKTGQITKYNLLMNEPVYISRINELNLIDTVNISEKFFVASGVLFDSLQDSVQVDDSIINFIFSLSHFLTDSIVVDDSDFELKINLRIDGIEPALVDDSGLFLILTIQQDLIDPVLVDDSIIEVKTNLELNRVDQVFVDDSIIDIKTNLEINGTDPVLVNDFALSFAEIIYGVLSDDIIKVSDSIILLTASFIHSEETVKVFDNGALSVDGPKLIFVGLTDETNLVDPALVFMGIK